ncbi:MAG: SGNH/GDSL hydrolase family protein [Lachnospiraceae bacterium]|nr:SGNH/GDSL hydrolase family protein [Lachnospiraceae bacterium]
MKKGTIAAIATAILLIVGLIGLGLFLTLTWQADLNASKEESAQAEQDADALLQELSGIRKGESASDESESPISDRDNTAAEDTTLAAESNSSDQSYDAGSDSQFAEEDSYRTALINHDEETDSESETEPDTEWVLELLAIEDTPVIWVGDSRTVGMQKALGTHTDDLFIGAAGKGYSWLSETGIPFLKSAISDYPDRPVIFNMGVNDYENLYNYMVLYAEVTAEYSGTVFYFLSVNPVDDEAGLYVTNANIEDFNTHLENAYPDTYLDSYSYLLESGTETIDGIHYSEEAYRQIYLFVKNALKSEV